MEWAKRLRSGGIGLALALVASACSVTSSPGAGPTPGGTATPAPVAGRTPRSAISGAPGAASPTTPGRTNPGTVPAAAYDDRGSVGEMARAYLRRNPATSMTVEIDWVDGRQPARQSMDHLSAVLRRELDKPGGITVQLGNRIAAGRSQWSLADLSLLQEANRSARSRGSRATMWVGFVDGSFAENPDALAVAFSASAAVVFRDRIEDAATSLVLEPEIERSVLLHEAGHLLALVNIGYRSRSDHEDPAHPNHSRNPESVMFWAVEDVSVRNILRGGPPDDFDAADRADLAMLRG